MGLYIQFKEMQMVEGFIVGVVASFATVFILWIAKKRQLHQQFGVLQGEYSPNRAVPVATGNPGQIRASN